MELATKASMSRWLLPWMLALGLLGGLAGGLQARTLVWARAADALTLDPHALDDGPTRVLTQQIYEPLIVRDAQGKSLPSLAESWAPAADPHVWVFRLRQGVKFHDGSDFTAQDVVFSILRAKQATSDFKLLLASIETVQAVDDYTVSMTTRGLNPILPSSLSSILIMSKAWALAHQAQSPQDLSLGKASFTASHSNGTGAFQLDARIPGIETTLKRFADYWGAAQVATEIDAVAVRVMPDAADRVAGLVKGEVDFLTEVPVAEIARLDQVKSVKVKIGAESRSIFLGLNVSSPHLASSNVGDRNPFADARVRQAMSIIIDRQLIQKTVMQGQSIPTGSVVPPGTSGYAREFDKIPVRDVAKARALMGDAGYGSGFDVTLNCPNDRFVNAANVCFAIVQQLRDIAVHATLVAQTKAIDFALIQRTPPATDFYLFGWGVPALDTENMLGQLVHSRGGIYGAWNATGYSNAKVDQMIEGLSAEPDLAHRNSALVKIWSQIEEERIYIPLHLQTLAYGMKADIDIAVDLANEPKLRFLRVIKPQ